MRSKKLNLLLIFFIFFITECNKNVLRIEVPYLKIMQISEASIAHPGDIINLKIFIKNMGSSKVENVEIIEKLPKGILYKQYSTIKFPYKKVVEPKIEENTIYWHLDSINPNEKITLSYRLIVSNSILPNVYDLICYIKGIPQQSFDDEKDKTVEIPDAGIIEAVNFKEHFFKLSIRIEDK